MKKNIFKTVFALMCACVMTTGFVACGSDDDDNNGNSPEQHGGGDVDFGKLQSGSAAFVVNITGLDAMKAIASDGKVMIRYTYNNGSVKNEELTQNTFQRSVSYSFNDKGDIVASMQVYLNGVDEEKLREVIGTQLMEVSMVGEVELKYENGTPKYAINNTTNYKVFERTEDNVNIAVRGIQRDIERNNGILPFASYGLRANSDMTSTSNSWKE